MRFLIVTMFMEHMGLLLSYCEYGIEYYCHLRYRHQLECVRNCCRYSSYMILMMDAHAMNMLH